MCVIIGRLISRIEILIRESLATFLSRHLRARARVYVCVRDSIFNGV